MNITLVIISGIVLILGIILFCISCKQKNYLNENYTIKGEVVRYRRIWKYLYPVIEFKDNNENKVIYSGGLVNYKTIKEGNEVKILKKENGDYLSECDVKHNKYFSICLMLTSILLIFIGFFIE